MDGSLSAAECDFYLNIIGFEHVPSSGPYRRYRDRNTGASIYLNLGLNLYDHDSLRELALATIHQS